MIEQVIDAKLAPLIDRLAELEEMLESGARRGRNAIQLGTVVKVVGKRVVIAMGKARTPPIKWFAVAAGDVIECRYPSKGEMALVLNYGSGDRNSSAIALVGIPSDQFPLPSDDQNLVIRKIGPLGWAALSAALSNWPAGCSRYSPPSFHREPDVGCLAAMCQMRWPA